MSKKYMYGLLLCFLVLGASFGYFFQINGKRDTAPRTLKLAQAEPLPNEEEINRISREIMDLKARYWAERVLIKKDVTLAELKQNSIHWIGDDGLYPKIEQIVKSSHVSPLTNEEQRRLDEAQNKIQHLLNPDMDDEAILSTLTQQECAELSARYWALRVLNDEKKWYYKGWEDGFLEPKEYYTESGDKIVNLDRNIKRKEEIKRLFLQYIQDPQNPPSALTTAESKRENACQYFDEQVASITRYPKYKYTGE
ncbi:MAG: hypothetical protein IJ311_01465 [Elusimicrobiaceae bacterium]|nr:hypothetical protein [Elusimicrobiaceae bacterium]